MHETTNYFSLQLILTGNCYRAKWWVGEVLYTECQKMAQQM